MLKALVGVAGALALWGVVFYVAGPIIGTAIFAGMALISYAVEA